MSNSALASAAATWQKIGEGINEPQVRKVVTHPSDPSLIFAATDRALYRSSDRGKHYQAIFQSSGINYIYIDASKIYAAADAGLYESPAAGNRWQRIYYASDEQARRCLSLIRVDKTLYLGTGKGLFTKTPGEANWSAVGNELGRKPVYQIVAGGHFLYFATDDALYDLDRRTSSYSRVFTAGSSTSLAAENEIQAEEAARRQVIRFIRVTPDDNAIYLATSHGIYLSGDEGEHWRTLADPPVDLEIVNAFVVLGEEEDRRVLVGTKRGAFLLEDGRWTPLYQGMETNAMNDLATDTRTRVYAATDAGVFYLSSGQALSSASANSFAQMQSPTAFGLAPSEPSIRDVHRWAVDYAEVGPEKIKSWRTLAGKRALLPDLSVGIDRADGEVFHWDTGTNPDTLLKGRDLLGWDVALSWDLGDLVWSTDQTTIDSRSKLMVELREDILDQVTRLYFERRRLQAELAAIDVPEPSLPFDKQLRIEELTALLDAFTGGKFSEAIVRGHKPTAANRKAKEENQ